MNTYNTLATQTSGTLTRDQQDIISWAVQMTLTGRSNIELPTILTQHDLEWVKGHLTNHWAPTYSEFFVAHFGLSE